MSRGGRDVPGALLTAGILVWPVGAAQGPAGAVDLVLALSWTHTETRKHTQRQEVKITAAQENVRGNGKGTGRRETREAKERRDFKETHPGDKFSVNFTSYRHALDKHPASFTWHHWSVMAK